MLPIQLGCEHDGSDAIRPYTSVSDDSPADNPSSHSRTPSTIDSSHSPTGTFAILVKRYDEWGVKEAPQTHFLFTKTNHSYKPPGAVSNYIHKLSVGENVMFKRK
ncbi:hypothetical protein EON65_29180 [archaeon]|nr:MAG: hypothetical protein EON65_29180 [archaeon]